MSASDATSPGAVSASDATSPGAAILRRARDAGLPEPLADAAQVETLVANGIDDAPLGTTRSALLEHRAPGVLRGLAARAVVTGATRLVVLTRTAATAAVKALQRAAANTEVSVVTVGDEYPAGDVASCRWRVTGRVAAPGTARGAPAVEVHVVERLLDLDGATRGEAWSHRSLTIAGEVRQPVVVTAPFEATVGQAIAATGGPTDPATVALWCDPFPALVADASEPLGRSPRDLLVLPARHPLVRACRIPVSDEVHRARSACDACRQCTDHCPPALLGQPLAPHEALRAVAYLREHDLAAVTGALQCTGCGVCNLVCPTGLHPRAVLTRVRDELRQRQPVPELPPASAQPPLPERQERIVMRSQVAARLGLAAFHGTPTWVPEPLTLAS